MGFEEVGWHCEGHNHGSVALARKIGFTQQDNYLMYIVKFDLLSHRCEYGMMAYYFRNYQEATEEFEIAFEMSEVDPWYYVLAAKSYAHLKNKEKSLFYLNKAVKKGWTEFEEFTKYYEFHFIHDSDVWRDLFIN